MAVKQTENPSISAQFHKAKKDKILSDAESSATLMGLISGKRETIVVDVFGTPVEIYQPSPRQLLPLQKVTVEILKVKAETERVKAETERTGIEDAEILQSVVEGFDSLQELCDITDQLLADLTVDPLLTFEAFSSGLIPESYKAKLLQSIQKWSSDRSAEKSKVENFRPDRKRSRSV